MRLVFDIEADELLLMATRMWCIVTKDIDTGEVRRFEPMEINSGVDYLCSADLLIGHNIINYDIPLIFKLTGIEVDVELFDTLVVSRLLNPDRRGGHSLGMWGQRVGRQKPEHEDWTQYSPEMLYRCEEDVEINHLVYDLLQEEMYGTTSKI